MQTKKERLAMENDDELTPEQIEDLKYWEVRLRFAGYSVRLVDRAEIASQSSDKKGLAFIAHDEGVYHGDLFLRDARSIYLPDNLRVEGELDLIETGIKSLPENLKVLGDAFFALTYISYLPKTLSVTGDVWLSMMRVPLTIPDGFVFNANLYANSAKIKWGHDVVVMGNLYVDRDDVVPEWVDVRGDVVRSEW